jgi:hypothetical protein
MAPGCGNDFKYVCGHKATLDSIQLELDRFKTQFVASYVSYQKSINKMVNGARTNELDEKTNPNVNYNTLKVIFLKMETLKREITGRISENSKVMKEMDTTIAKNKKVAGAVSAEMTTLSNKADGSTQAYKDALGLYRKDIFKNIVFIFASGGIMYMGRKVFMEAS